MKADIVANEVKAQVAPDRKIAWSSPTLARYGSVGMLTLGIAGSKQGDAVDMSMA